jgi:hypothetical protein
LRASRQLHNLFSRKKAYAFINALSEASLSTEGGDTSAA